ncbi:helix-turn-helix transcriptional regulator [Rhizobium lusitanum]|uniref:helix-turn-helix transcriptional regulator n=1 Tax=Rhizobium lusitanum TaxID=293958 RepID=UPI00191CB270
MGWSQAELAKAANISRQTVADFDRRANPSRPSAGCYRSTSSPFRSTGSSILMDVAGKNPRSLNS